MAKNKNFEIDRANPNDCWITAKDVKIGDIFEREGSLHMRVNYCFGPIITDKITICNLNTGSTWQVSDTEQYRTIKTCKIKYELK